MLRLCWLPFGGHPDRIVGGCYNRLELDVADDVVKSVAYSCLRCSSAKAFISGPRPLRKAANESELIFVSNSRVQKIGKKKSWTEG